MNYLGIILEQARAVGAQVLTTDFVPMNERVDKDSGYLVEVRKTHPFQYAGLFQNETFSAEINQDSLEEQLEEMIFNLNTTKGRILHRRFLEDAEYFRRKMRYLRRQARWMR